ncbi:MAG: sensor domain-containing diguanylate cyclase [bacterium]|nr:sensor domain-containing diguanylate cyclase [bacterium]
MDKIVKKLAVLFLFLLSLLFNMFSSINIPLVLLIFVFIAQFASLFLYGLNKKFYDVHLYFLVAFSFLIPLYPTDYRSFGYFIFLLFPPILMLLKRDTVKSVYALVFSALPTALYLASFFSFTEFFYLSLLASFDIFASFFIFKERKSTEKVKSQFDNYNAKSNLINVSPFMPNKERVMESETSYGRKIISQIEEAVCAIVEIAAKCIDARSVIFMIYDEENDSLFIESGVSSSPINTKKNIAEKNNILYWVVKNRKEISDNLFIGDPKNLCLYPNEEVIRSIIAVPVLYGNHVSGVLFFDSSEENRFTVKNIETTKLFADEISRIFSFAQYAEQAKTEATYLSLLNDFAHKLSRTLVYSEILQIISDAVSSFFTFSHSFVASVEGAQAKMLFSSDKNFSDSFKVENSFLFLATAESEIFYKTNLQKREIPLPVLYRGENLRRIDFALSLPIFQTGGRTDYFIFASDKKNIDIGPAAQIVLNFISDISKTAVEKSMLYEQTRELSIKDGLTNLHNHRYFQEELTKMMNNSKRTGGRLAVALIDIDFFKKFNDTYGHQTGDLVLKHLSKIMSSSVRQTDLVARYGGEEFVIVLSNITQDSPMALLEQIRRKVETTPLAHESLSEPLSVTISIGYSTFPNDSDSKVDIIKMADQALYDAKKSGRNQVKNYSR